jgi:glutathione S-transferase
MKLYSAVDDYCLQKVKLVLALTGKECEIQTGCSVEDLTKLDAAAKSMVLDTGAGCIGLHVAILRYLADAKLLGSSDIDRAMVDQWLEFSWEELGK